MKHIGNLEITSGNQENFKDLVEVTGYLYVYGSAKLEQLQTVGGDLRVYGSAKLEAPQLQTVGGDLYVDGSAKLEAPNLKEEKTSQEVIEKIRTESKRKVHADFERQGYLFADGILQEKLSKKVVGSLTVYKTKKIGKHETAFVVYDGVNYSHGNTIEEAKNDLMFKLSTRDTSEFKKWRVTDVKPLNEIIRAYRSITGACEFGTKNFCQSQDLKDSYTLKEVFKLTDGKFGNDKFVNFQWMI